MPALAMVAAVTPIHGHTALSQSTTPECDTPYTP